MIPDPGSLSTRVSHCMAALLMDGAVVIYYIADNSLVPCMIPDPGSLSMHKGVPLAALLMDG